MSNSKIQNIEILDELVVGRVKPHIYAFTTNTVPNYYKIGDTFRPISKRLNEWKIYFPELNIQYQCEAIINADTYFRDYAIHKYLEQDLKRERLQPSELQVQNYYSREFFKIKSTKDIDEAIKDIKENYKENNKYDYYSVNERLPQIFQYKRGEEWKLRPNQEEVVNNFKRAIDAGRTNLLMYAVMRFGKSFTSLCCALEINAKIILIVSAKADVKSEWQKTVQIPGNFKDYKFLDSNCLENEGIIRETLKQYKVVLFLTLQDLQGDIIKQKHKEVFENSIDLLIIDETHFGVRAESFGKVLNDIGYDKTDEKNINKLEDDEIDTNKANMELKKLKAKYRLHLSGTPYRILMGSEFTQQDIISFIQFSDIVREQENWNKDNLHKQGVNEWDNPYYGFPQMLRFAFNPNQSTRNKLEELKKNGITFAFSKLFEPQSIIKDSQNNGHKKFKNEQEILDLLQVIDGMKPDDELLGFLDYDKIKKGNMCRHMVMVLPYCASCDAMEELINKNHDKFKNIKEYEIINISGVDSIRKYRYVDVIKTTIKECESKNKKTLTLTVNRMLTGSTVEQWDTMLYFKDTSSPQEYDQAIFRLQNQYIRTLSSSKGVIKEVLKPQTIFIDFDPNRLFRMQEQKALIYNINIDQNGNDKLKERLNEELYISPVIIVNHNKIKKVEATDILAVVSEYNTNRSIIEEVVEIPIDLSLLEDQDIKKAIECQIEFYSKKGLTIYPNQGEFDELDTDLLPNQKVNNISNQNNSNGYDINGSIDEVKILENKLKTYYQRILFLSFLIKNNVSSLSELIEVIDEEYNNRICQKLYIDKHILQKINKLMNPFKRSKLDYKIQNISTLSRDKNIQPIDRAYILMKKFTRISESEIITPSKLCDEMVNLLSDDIIRDIRENNNKILDIASKFGEYILALYKKLSNLGYSHEDINNMLYAIPTSSLAYEFTKKIYEILNLNVENIAEKFNTYDLMTLKDNKGNIDYNTIEKLLRQNKKFNEITLDDKIILRGEDEMKFGAIVGNPPYQEPLQGTSDRQIYHHFMDISYQLSDIVVFVTPGKFLLDAGKTPKEWNKKMLDDEYLQVARYETDSSEIFPDISLSSSIAITVRNSNQKVGPIKRFYPDSTIRNIVLKVVNNKEFESISTKIYLQSKFNMDTVLDNYPEIENIIRNERRLITSILQKNITMFQDDVMEKNKNEYIKIYGNNENGKLIYKYVKRMYIDCENNNIDGFKVMLAATNGAAGNLGVEAANIIGEPKFLEKSSGYTQTFISIGNFNDEQEARNLCKYLKTKFARFMIGTLKATQRLNKEVFCDLPTQDFCNNLDINWSQSCIDIDKQLYKKYDLSKDEIDYIESKIKLME